jgi:bifunctional ADP-heptose synthase (sugar kinase/adenylyltransferase)
MNPDVNPALVPASTFDSQDIEVGIWFRNFASLFQFEEISHYLTALSKLRVTLVGESIVDKYTSVNPLSKTSKDPILAFHLGETKTFFGGILAIASNVCHWVDYVQVISCCKTGDEYRFVPSNSVNMSMKLVQTASPTITKHRYIDKGTNSKVFETYDFDPTFFQEDFLIENTSISSVDFSKADVTIIADYGHGLMTPELIGLATNNSNFLCVNVQSNAGNRGFNTFDKYPKFNFFTANSGELQIQSRQSHPDFGSIMKQIINDKNAKMGIMTEGRQGLTVFTPNRQHSAMALASQVIDKVGAGDSVLAISSLLAYLDTPIEVIAFISNLVAAREVRTQGHQNPISIDELKRVIKEAYARL